MTLQETGRQTHSGQIAFKKKKRLILTSSEKVIIPKYMASIYSRSSKIRMLFKEWLFDPRRLCPKMLMILAIMLPEGY